MFVFIIGVNSLFHIYIFLWDMTFKKKTILNKEIIITNINYVFTSG